MAKNQKSRTKNENGLNANQQLFCHLYGGMGERKFMGNATLSYIEAYGVDTVTFKVKQKGGKMDYTSEYKNASSSASELLLNPNISQEIKNVFKSLFNAETVDNELLKVIMQDWDPRAKVQGVREFNELKGRIIKKIKLSGAMKSVLPANQLGKLAEYVARRAKEKK